MTAKLNSSQVQYPKKFNPYTGEPRDERDIATDPDGILIVHPNAPVRPAQRREQASQAVRDLPPEKDFVWKGTDEDDRPSTPQELSEGVSESNRRRGPNPMMDDMMRKVSESSNFTLAAVEQGAIDAAAKLNEPLVHARRVTNNPKDLGERSLCGIVAVAQPIYFAGDSGAVTCPRCVDIQANF